MALLRAWLDGPFRASPNIWSSPMSESNYAAEEMISTEQIRVEEERSPEHTSRVLPDRRSGTGCSGQIPLSGYYSGILFGGYYQMGRQ